jgi:Icc protein
MLPKSCLRVIQITDTHLFADRDREMRGIITSKSLQIVLDKVRELHPDLLLLTGDLSQDETAESYQLLSSLITPLTISTYWIPGNHDRIDLMEQILQSPPIYLDKSFAVGGWHFLLLNSTIAGSIAGELSAESLAWLDDRLQEIGDRPTLIALHHPPFFPNPNWESTILQNPDNFWLLGDRYPQIKIVLSGHIHQEFEACREGVSYLATPSTCTQFDVPEDSAFTLGYAEPGLRVLELYSDGTWKSWVERVIYKLSE